MLVTDAADDSDAMTRLRAVQRTTDGFELAELDIALRKEGELLGLRQSGLPPLRVARLADPRHRQQSLVARQRGGAPGRAATVGCLPGNERLEHELTSGWLARIGAGDVLGRGRARWLTPVGSSAAAPAASGCSAPGEGTRPFGDRVKQALFGSLETDPAGAAGRGRSWTCSRAAARRASRRSAGVRRRAVFVERDAGSRPGHHGEPAPGRASDGGRLVRADVLRFLEGDAARGRRGPFSGVVLDPPYAETDLLEAALERLADPARGWLTDARGRGRQASLALDRPSRSLGCLERCSRSAASARRP